VSGSRTRDLFLAGVFALTGLVIVVDQAAIVLTQILPATPGLLGWRYGSVGLTVGRTTPLLLADLLLMLSALWVSNRLLIRLLAVGHFLLVPLLGLVLLSFALDALQVIGGMPEPQVPATRAAALRAAGMLALLIGFAGWTGWLLWRVAGSVKPEQKTVERSVLVVGSDHREPGAVHER
jgi:hypothetical protein